jgi:DNA-binding XRE family transcriptional regulator
VHRSSSNEGTPRLCDVARHAAPSGDAISRRSLPVRPGKRVRVRRDTKEITQDDLEAAVGVRRRDVVDIERSVINPTPTLKASNVAIACACWRKALQLPLVTDRSCFG